MTTKTKDDYLMYRAASDRWFLSLPTGGETIAYLAGNAAVSPTGALQATQRVATPSGTFVALATAVLFHVNGPGNNAVKTFDLRRTPPACTPVVRRRDSAVEITRVSAEVVTPRDQIEYIKSTLSLGATEIADVLGVSRATVYNWISGQIPTPKDPATANRLRWIHAQAVRWENISPYQLGRLRHAPISDDGTNLIDLLREGRNEEARVQAALVALGSRAESRAVSTAPSRTLTTSEVEDRRAERRDALEQIRSLGI